jgi:transcriptional regulator with XRE-family HTH domain
MAKKQEGLGLTGQLREAIRDSGQSLNQLGKASGVHNTQLSRFMRGERDLSLAAAEKVCQALNLELVSKPAPEKTRGCPRKKR